jgi:hypothetical protein
MRHLIADFDAGPKSASRKLNPMAIQLSETCPRPSPLHQAPTGFPHIRYNLGTTEREKKRYAVPWGTALAFHLAARKPEFIRGLAFMEFIWPCLRGKIFTQMARNLQEVQDTPSG